MENNNINPWVSIWTQPRNTIRSIINSDPRRYIIWLAIIGGILSTWLSYAWKWHTGIQEVPLLYLIMAVIILGAIWGVAMLYLGGWLYQLTGSWIGGKGSFIETKCAVGWGQYPFIISSIFNVAALYFSKNMYLQSLFGFIAFVLLIWGFIVFVKLISEAHQFSFWKGLLAILIALILVFVVFMIIALLMPLLSPIFSSAG